MDRETLDVYDAKAAEYDTVFCKGATPDAQMQAFLAALPDRADILDLGCGPGRSSALIAQHGHRVTATDASAQMIALASQHEGVTARQESFDDLDGDAIYDGVFANFSLLHAAPEDQPRHLQDITKALRPSGILHIGMKTGDGVHRDGIGRRYTFVTQDSLTDMLKIAGLTPDKVWTGASPGLDGTVAPWIVMHAQKHG